MAERKQRKRTKGWKMPENTVYVGRPTKWGNPYHVTREMWAEECVRLYKKDILNRDARITPEEIIEELHGKDLACWCPLDQPCHADVLLELANA